MGSVSVRRQTLDESDALRWSWVLGRSEGIYDPVVRDLTSASVLSKFLRSRPGIAYLAKLRGPMKTRLRNEVVRRFAGLPGRVHILMMPGLLWQAEKDLLVARDGPSMLSKAKIPPTTRIHAVEWSKTIFRASLEFMPGSAFGVQHHASWDLSSRAVCEYRCTAFEDYEPPVQFAAAWIDFCGPLTERRIARLADLWAQESMRLLVVTWMRARQTIKDPLWRLLRVTPGAEERELHVYHDSAAPMVQLFSHRGGAECPSSATA